MASPKMITPEERISQDLRSKGVAYIRDAMRDDKASRALVAAMSNSLVRSALVEALAAEGRRLMEEHKRSRKPISDIPKMASPIGEILVDSSSRKRLRELMVSQNGILVLDAMVSKTEGDFLTLGYLFNAPGGKNLVARMLLSNEGRETAGHIVMAATYAAPDPYYTPKLPPYKPTIDGKRFREQLSTDTGARELHTSLDTRTGRKALANFFKEHGTEAKSVLREALTTKDGVQRLGLIMKSEQGRDFLSMLGGNLGRSIAGDDLWTTAGGRQLVRALLISEDGLKAIFSLVTGF